MTKKERLVSAIAEGTVIDHIDVGQALKIVRFLNLPSHKKVVYVGLNLPSRAMGHKDLIKVEGRELSQEEANEVAIIAPHATINIIRKYSIAKKFTVSIPKSIVSFIVCPNKKCITNHERISSHFSVSGKESLRLTCHFCERVFNQEEITDYNL